ncbi:MAG: alpha/beta hydrolase [bacterium]|nr:alpha/beta hydrolase [bacterium]
MKIVKRIVQGIGILIGIVVVYLVIVTFAPGFSAPEQPLGVGREHQLIQAIDATALRSRKDVNFDVNGTTVRAWLYLPDNLSAPVPCIVMATGFGGTKDFLLEPYAVRFQEAGYAALLFDYRHFGESDGEPRQLIWAPFQLEDYEGAIAYARSLTEIDPARIALWGTSFSGGHVLVTAANDHNIACVSAQIPGLDPLAAAETESEEDSIEQFLLMFMHAQRDMLRHRLGLAPHTIPIVGKPGTLALLTAPGAHGDFGKLVPENYVNEACARFFLRSMTYRPVEYARDVRSPVLLQIADHDSIIPKNAADETIKVLGDYADVKHYPIGHFDIYIGENFERSVSDQLDFFKKHLS